MKTFSFGATIEEGGNIQAKDRYGAYRMAKIRIVQAFGRNTHKTINYIGGDEVVGECEVCSDAIFEDEDYEFDNEGVHLHDKCPEGK